MITVLAGGVGAARFLTGLVQAVPAREVTAIVNVADDLRRHGLAISPDLDSITYHLAGVTDPTRQWGRADERHVVATELRRFGLDDWFTLGDRDLATHLYRTMLLRQGATLSEATAAITRAFGLEARILPATDDRVTTRIHTADGRDLHFQEWWVRLGAAPEVAGVVVDGVEAATPAPGVLAAIRQADAVLLAPSNPVVSIGTVLAVPGIREAVTTTRAPVVGMSPIVGGAVVRGMAHRLLPAIGVEVSAAGVARHYGALLDGWVVDATDEELVGELDVETVATDTILDDPDVAAAAARTMLALADDLGGRSGGTGAVPRDAP